METEKFELMLDEAQANAALEKGMLYADTFVNKNYLINLDRYPLQKIYSGLSPFASTQLSYGENYSKAVSTASCLESMCTALTLDTTQCSTSIRSDSIKEYTFLSILTD